ncbi:MAG: hypothetical protein AAFV07_15915 [Bacteroidota bacterium]
MEDLFKKFLYTGVGLVSLTAEKLQEAVDDLVGKGKLSEKEGKKIINDFFDNTETKKAEFETKMKEAVDSVVDKLSFPSKVEMEALQNRIAELEAQLAAKTEAETTTPEATAPAEEPEAPKKKPAPRKRATRKKKTDDDKA